ncbi:MAG: DUF721 domain-containing protein [Thermoleophilia bacterium]|nr:DUF721 domain-containing protein [Thermoleophilia bacterium]
MTEPTPVSDIVRRERERLFRNCPGLGLQALWVEAAGPEIANHAAVRSMREGILTVSCDSGSWACELALHAGSLTEKINRLSPPDQVREIRFVHGIRNDWKSRK